jgi:soluble lytic murein transglycosylase-like protein
MLRAIPCCVFAGWVFALAAPAAPAAATERGEQPAAAADRGALEALIAQHANANGVPLALARQVIRRESNFNPRAANSGNYGLMQIRLGTARALGYSGTPEGLLDPEVNMTYGMRYLAGAYRAANGDEGRTLVLYSRGYYQQQSGRRVGRSLCLVPFLCAAK